MIWPTINYTDAPAALEFLTSVFGFTERLVVRDESDNSVIVHAQLRWPEGGGIMLGTANRDGNVFSQRPVGASSTYIESNKLDDLYRRAVAAGTPVLDALSDKDFGGRGFSVRDPEGNIWSFGDYEGE